MKKILVTLTYLMLIHVVSGQQYEKVALEYFVESIMPEQFPEIQKIRFEGRTKKEISNANYFEDCYDKDAEFLASIKGEFQEQNEVQITIKEELKKRIKICRISENYKKTYITVDKANITESNIFVSVNIQEKNDFYNSYFIKMSLDGEIVDWCYSGEIY